MFETVAPETVAPRSRKVFYESLPMSLFAHAVIGVAIVLATIWDVKFPLHSPRMHMAYTLEMMPTPPPAPPAAPAKQQAVPKPIDPRPVPIDEVVAPTIIPDEIPDVPVMEAVQHSVGEGTGGAALVQGWTAPAGEGDGPGTEKGVPGGVEGGIGEELPPNTVRVKRHQSLPMSMTPMSMVYPFYPDEARLRGWEDAVTVRYVIGKDGRVKSVEVLDPPQRPVFETTVVKAIRHWRFRPLVKDGVAQEVIHELVVYFKLQA